MSSSPPIAVLIPSWNSAGYLRPCLASLEGQGVELELMVIDNGSVDGSRELLERECVPHLALPENLGFAAAVNRGASLVRAREILVLNVDTVLEPGCIAALADALRGDRTLGGVGPRILQLEDGDRTGAAQTGAGSPTIYSAGQALKRDGRAYEQGQGERQRPRHLERLEIFGVCGAACLLRRELFDELGGYDERYFAFYEDVDLNVRARIAGWRFEYVPDAVVWHAGNAVWKQGFKRPGPENARLVARNRLATQIKFMPVRAIPRIGAVEVGSLARAARRGRFIATLAGKLSALRWLPALLRERGRLRREGDPDLARRWLGVSSWGSAGGGAV